MASRCIHIFVLLPALVYGYITDWPGRTAQPTCMDIPRNMTLCHGIGYTKMRLPNLLNHDTMAEVSQQAGSWVPLLNVRCHPDTQLFLCSLFSPVCLERLIYPCRSLCEKVREGCEGRMQNYGFPWPNALQCDKFPLDNDMCIAPQSNTTTTTEAKCQACNQVETYENILDNFCRADFAVKTKIRRVRKSKIMGKKSKTLKGAQTPEQKRQLKRPVFVLDPEDACCEENLTRNSRDTFLIMGQWRERQAVPTFIMPWGEKSKELRKAVRVIKKLNCSDPKIISHTVIDGGRKRRGKKNHAKRRNRHGNKKTQTGT